MDRLKDFIALVFINAIAIYMGLLTIAAIENWKYGNPEFEIAIESEYNPEYKEYEDEDEDEDQDYDRESDESSYSYSL